MERVLLKLSGEALGESGKGINKDTIKTVAKEIYDAWIENVKAISIVVGGGNYFRGRDAMDLGMDRVTMDYMGMTGTILNAIYLREALKQLGAKVVVLTCLELPQVLETYSIDAANKYLSDNTIVIYGGGTGKPYFSTDTASLLRAKDTKVKTVLMAKNGVDGVYDKDPNKFSDAKKIDKLTHDDVINNKLEFMDLSAAQIANENDIDLVVFDCLKKDAIKNAILGEISGTVVKKSF